MNGWTWIGVVLLGGAGAVGRFLLDRAVAGRTGGDLPFGTLAVNASGALALGLLAGLAVSGTLLVLAGTAALGSYTTFSTWMLESERLGEEGRGRAGSLNVLASLAIGFAAAALGHAIGALL